MEKKRELFSIIGVFLVLSFVSASFNLGDSIYSIETEYPQSTSIKGWVNISLGDEAADSLFSDSFGNSIRLINLLELNNDSNHTCLPNDCTPDYIIKGIGETTKIFNLNSGEEKVIGFKIIGDRFESLSGFSINVSSDVGETDLPGLYIDILNDEKIEWTPYTSSNTFYDKIYGCYAVSPEISQDFLYEQRYCQKINLPVTSRIELGANVIKRSEESGSVDFEFEIRDPENRRGFCEVTASNSGEITCDPNYRIQGEGEFLICINTKSSLGANKYKINTEVKETCGYAIHEGNKKDFEIFARPSRFSAIGEFSLNENELQNSGNFIGLGFYIDRYLERYNFKCSGGCMIPISFTAGTNAAQEITLSNIEIEYVSSGTPKETNKIYDLESTAAKISSEFQKIYLDEANFSVSGDSNEKIDYSLSLNNNELFSEEIIIREVPKIISLNTQKVVAGYPIEFILRVRNDDTTSQIIEYKWDFGDSTNITGSIGNKTTHTYSSIGNFTLKVSIKNSRGLESSKEFEIIVGTPKDSVASLLKEKSDKLNKIKLKIEVLPLFQKNSLNAYLNIPELETEISNLKKRNEIVSLNKNYIPIINDLIKLDVPYSLIKPMAINNFQFYSNKEGINLDILTKISGEEYDINLKEEYINTIILWNLENLDAEVDSEAFSISYSEEDFELAMNFFILDIKGNSQLEGSFLIIQKFQDMVLKEDYGENEISGYYYFELSSEGKKIEFSTTEELDLSTVEIFVSPKISNLEIVRLNISEGNGKVSRTAIIILTIFLVFLIGLIAYLVLQEWYRNKYESYLFKNKNNLYNIVSYVHREKKKESKSLEISKKLKKAGWSSEQVKYVMKKYAGKRTGMIEIPLRNVFNFFSEREKKKTSKDSHSKKP